MLDKLEELVVTELAQFGYLKTQRQAEAGPPESLSLTFVRFVQPAKFNIVANVRCWYDEDFNSHIRYTLEWQDRSGLFKLVSNQYDFQCSMMGKPDPIFAMVDEQFCEAVLCLEWRMKEAEFS